MEHARIAGVGMLPFRETREVCGLPHHGRTGCRLVLADVGLDVTDLQQAYASYVYGDSTSGQAVLSSRTNL